MDHSREIFWIDPETGVVRSYSEFVEDVNHFSSREGLRDPSGPYALFVRLVHALASENEVDLLDDAISIGEGDSLEDRSSERAEESGSFRDWDHLMQQIRANGKKHVVGLYTSGTTGRPRKVLHSFETLSLNVKTGEKSSDNVWALAYNPSHIAGLQVFFQAFLNKNSLVYVFDAGGQSLMEHLRRYSVTHISATPTFYRRLLFDARSSVESIRVVTLGGEQFDPSLVSALQKVFPNARVRNIYASTEAGSLFSSDDDIFTVPPNLSRYVSISPSGELLIHRHLLAVFEEGLDFEEWYPTGDIVEQLGQGRFRFVSRATEMINVGGYKVNPHEIEQAIREVPGVLDAVVKARANRITGNILVSDVEKEDRCSSAALEKNIYRHLQQKLQHYQIPRIINFVSDIGLTRTGKKTRT